MSKHPCINALTQGSIVMLLSGLSHTAYCQPPSAIPTADRPQHDTKALRDPTQPARFDASNNKSKGGLQIRSIIIGKTRRVALINDTFVQIGDRIGTATVLSISKNSVDLIDAGRTVRLYLFENDIRK